MADLILIFGSEPLLTAKVVDVGEAAFTPINTSPLLLAVYSVTVLLPAGVNNMTASGCKPLITNP